MKLRLKGRIKAVLTAPQRAARRRGFGVHSPFAFSFIRNVIAQPCRYYAYSELDKLCRPNGLSKSDVRLLFRVMLSQHPSTIGMYCSQPTERIAQYAGRLACPQARRADSSPMDMIITDAEGFSEKVIEAAVMGTSVVILTPHKDDVNALWRATSRGMLFCRPHITIYIAHNHLPHQRFDV